MAHPGNKKSSNAAAVGNYQDKVAPLQVRQVLHWEYPKIGLARETQGRFEADRLGGWIGGTKTDEESGGDLILEVSNINWLN